MATSTRLTGYSLEHPIIEYQNRYSVTRKTFFMKIMIKFYAQSIINVRYNRNRTHKPALGICLHNNYWSIKW